MLIFVTLTLSIVLCNASLLRRNFHCTDGPHCEDDYLESVCLPTNAAGAPDLSAPCVLQEYIDLECRYEHVKSPPFKDISDIYTPPTNAAQRSNNSQRLCFCESQYFQNAQGCVDCFKAHGRDSNINFIEPWSSMYCDAAATPTLDFYEFLASVSDMPKYKTALSSVSAAATTFSDPIGNKTEVSLYCTPAVTGSAAWAVGNAKATTTFVEDGQIVATATATSDGGAIKRTEAAIAGLVGLAGVGVIIL